jgi:hypothetical protein
MLSNYVKPNRSFNALIIISVFALLFGSWFSMNQLNAIATDAWQSYPKLFLTLTILKCYLTILVFYALSRAVLKILSQDKLSDAMIALSFLPLLVVFTHVAMYWVASSILLLQLVLLVSVLRMKDYRLLMNNYLADACVLLFYFVINFIFTSAFSPLNWDKAMVAAAKDAEGIPLLGAGFKGYLLAKQFSFANVDYSQWAGIMNPPISFNSTFIQMIGFIFDLPSVSVEVFHVVIMVTYFLIFIFGSFGFYLFLRYAARLRYSIAIFGGFLLFFSATPNIENSFLSDGGVMLSAFIVLPYAMLLMSLAFEKNNKLYVALASVAMAAQFFIYTPHPEGTIYSLLLFAVYSAGLMLFTHTMTWTDKLRCALVSMTIFFCLAGYVIFPILIDRLSGNMYVFAHIGDVEAVDLQPQSAYLRLLAIFAPIAIYLLYRQRKITPVFKSSLLLASSLVGLFLIASSVPTLNFLIKKFHIGIHLWVTSRLGVYFCMSVFIICMYAFDSITQAIINLISQYYPGVTRKGSTAYIVADDSITARSQN